MLTLWTLSAPDNKAAARQVRALAAALAGAGPGESPAPIAHLFPTAAQTGIADLDLAPPWPDLAIACMEDTAALARDIKRASGNAARLIAIQDPGAENRAAFDLIIRQPQERLDGPNVIASRLALHGVTPALLDEFRASFAAPLAKLPCPITAVLIGGSDEHIALQADAYRHLAGDLRDAATGANGTLIALTSRRTDAFGQPILRAALNGLPNLHLDDPALPYEAALAAADTFIVTADSLSMASEALATGQPVTLNDCGGALAAHPVAAILAAAVRLPYRDELPDLACAIRQRLFVK